jgi:hypothetical protein
MASKGRSSIGGDSASIKVWQARTMRGTGPAVGGERNSYREWRHEPKLFPMGRSPSAPSGAASSRMLPRTFHYLHGSRRKWPALSGSATALRR